MGRTEGRSPDATRQLILDAAAAVVRRDGLAATLDDIAAEAGVSKGGLVYHYASKKKLLVALGDHLAEMFRQEVDSRVDPGDASPGALTRAYIGASFADADDVARMHDSIVLAAHLASEPELREIAEADGARWREELGRDGLPSLVVSLVIAATDGVGTGPLWGAVLRRDDLDELESYLITLTRDAGAPNHA
jgi:AcrR family transcriptional regulator